MKAQRNAHNNSDRVEVLTTPKGVTTPLGPILLELHYIQHSSWSVWVMCMCVYVCACMCVVSQIAAWEADFITQESGTSKKKKKKKLYVCVRITSNQWARNVLFIFINYLFIFITYFKVRVYKSFQIKKNPSTIQSCIKKYEYSWVQVVKVYVECTSAGNVTFCL